MNDLSNAAFTPILYKKRWFMLLIFSGTSMLNAYQWIHLSIVSDRVLYIWDQTVPGKSVAARQMAVDWLSMVYLLAYIPLIIPATWASERYGLRVTLLLAAAINDMGAWIKCLAGITAVDPNRSPRMNQFESASFAILMIGQILDAIAQVFILGVPAQLASIWFGEREVGTATSIGVLANQLGVALGFAIPPLVVPVVQNHMPIGSETTYAYMHRHMMYLLYVGAVMNTVPVLVVALFFKRQPPTEPTYAQYARRMSRLNSKQKSDLVVINGQLTNEFVACEHEADTDVTKASHIDANTYDTQMRVRGSTSTTSKLPPHNIAKGTEFKVQFLRVVRNSNYLLLVISYGINTGVYYALGTLLNVILQEYFPGNIYIGWIGFVMIISGILGSIIAGILLDRTKKYKIIISLIYLLTILWMGGFTGLLLLHSLIFAFISSFFLGLTMTGFLPIGFEYAAELTYPANEGLTSGLLNTAAQICGIIFTISASQMSVYYDAKWINILFTCLLVFGFSLLIFIKEDLRRQKMQQNAIESSVELANKELNVSQL